VYNLANFLGTLALPGAPPHDAGDTVGVEAVEVDVVRAATASSISRYEAEA
jgi:hypothetical protein